MVATTNGRRGKTDRHTHTHTQRERKRERERERDLSFKICLKYKIPRHKKTGH
jgi:hypothetical protein